MPRPKGPGAIKFLDAATQDDVAMRNILWRGNDVYERKLSELYTAMAPLALQHWQLQARQEHLCNEIKTGSENPMARAVAKMKLQDVKSQIASAETKLRNIKKQIEETLGEMRQSPRKKVAYSWQEMTVRLIMELKMIQAETNNEGEFVLGTKGATISTKLLQRLLRAVGFSVGERQLRRFIHDRCGVIGQQGKRTDLA
jgi:seryl-tRNA synthetase